METFEQQIQPFIQPLIYRIQVLEDENKQLKVSIDELKQKGQKVGNDNKHNRTQTQTNTRVGRPVTTKPNIETKQPVGIKKQTKIPEKHTLPNVDKIKTPLSGKKEATNANQVKEPKTDGKQLTQKVITSPKLIKGKQTSNTNINAPTNKVNGIKPVDIKDLKPSTTKLNPLKPVTVSHKTQAAPKKSYPIKSLAPPPPLQQIQPQTQQHVTPTQPITSIQQTQTKLQIKPEQYVQKVSQPAQNIQQVLPVESNPDQLVKINEQLRSQPIQPPKTQQITVENISQHKQPQLTQAQEQEELI